MSCLQNFTTKEILNKHREQCLLVNDTQAIKHETGTIKFKNHNKQIPIPFKIYADSECLLKRTNIKLGKHTQIYQNHVPNSIGAKLVCADDKFTSKTKIVIGSNCIKEFIEWIFEQKRYCHQIINKKSGKKLRMSLEDENNYKNSQDCRICNQKIKDKDKVRHHCYIAVEYKGPAHEECNEIPRKLTIIFHNLEGYDRHLIFRELNNFKDIDIQVIPKTNERYMSIIVNNSIAFLDSLQFLSASLDTLAGNLEDKDLKHLLSEFPKDKLEILKRKDSYPYEWVDSYKKFTYPRLPPKETFYSSLDDGKRCKGNAHISDEQYLHLKNVWKEFGFRNFGDFRNHYLKKDVLLLVDVFEKFISKCLKYYNLDPCYYFSAPGLSWDAMLKMTKVESENISNERYSEANNKYCPDYDKNKPENYIFYLDMNNLYGGAVSEYLPYGGFKWVKVNNKTINRVLNESDNSLHGYFLEVDLHYPENLHDDYNGYSLAPEKFKVGEEMLSPSKLEMKKENYIKVGSINKLIPNLMSKKNCVVHYKNLKYYLSKGLILKKVHRILEFKQSDWMKPYIDFNTERRKEATNEADKNLFKLLNNAVYGKTMENMRKRIKIRITINKKDFLKYAAKYVTNTVLELSKLEMYKIYYDFAKKNVNVYYCLLILMVYALKLKKIFMK